MAKNTFNAAAASQKFDFAPMGDGSFKIVSKGDPSMVLKVQSGIFASDQPVVLNQFKNYSSQKWNFLDAGSGTVKIQNVGNTSYYLKNKSGIVANNNTIVISTWVDTAEMKWIEK